MKVRHKIILTSTICVALAVMIIYILAYNILLFGLTQVEDSRIANNVGLVEQAVTEDAISLDSICKDYSMWDDAYSYVKGEKDNYADVDLSADTLSKLNIHSVAVLKNNGTVLMVMKIVNGSGTVLPPDDYLYLFYKDNAHKFIQHDERNYSKGLLMTPDGSGLFSSRPVLTGNGTGPVYATMVMVELMDDYWIQHMALRTGVKATFYDYDSGSMPIDLSGLKEKLPKDGTVIVKNVDENTVAGYALLTDSDNKPNTLIKIWVDREIYLKGKTAMLYFLVSLIIIGVIFSALAIYLVDVFLIRPLSEIKNKVISNREKKDMAARIDYAGDDELSSFAKSMNDALDSIEKMNEEKQAIFYVNPDTFIRTSSSGEIIDYKLNKPFKDMNISIGKLITDIFSAEVIEKIIPAFLESEKNDAPATLEFPMIISNASSVSNASSGISSSGFSSSGILDMKSENSRSYIELRVVSMKDKGHVMILRDMTERNRIELELLEKNKDLERFNKFATDRELRMIDLKKENDALKKENDLFKKDTAS